MMTESNGIDQTSIVSSIEGKLPRQSSLHSASCIFRVPDILCVPNKNIFVPKLISIGPYHHGKKNVRETEKIKLRYLRCLLERKPTLETKLESFVESISIIEKDCRECYAEEIHFSADKFVEIMVVDGCFIIEFFRKLMDREKDKDDPVFSTSWMYLQIETELLLLENQLPWRVLSCLFEMTDDKKETSLAILAASSIGNLVLANSTDPNNNLADTPLHLLDLVRSNILGSDVDTKPELTKSFPDHIPSVTELLQAGVKFKKKENSRGIVDITFKDGVMEIPQICVWEKTGALLRNLIAFDQCDKNGQNKITSYIVLLDNLINNRKDVDFLVEQDIVRNYNSVNTKDTASFFNRLSFNAGLDYFLYMDLYTRVNEHYRGRWNRWRAILKRDYFNNPWSILSFIAAIIILLLSFIQALYSMLSYKY